ncbi:MAG: NfeD family protein [Candidatus Paceibacterota bacterium]|jgi:membrane protein implicated in regulation of membrane protease activity
MTALLAVGITSAVLGTTQFLVFAALAVCGLIALGVAAIFGGDHDVDHDADVGGHDMSHDADSGGEHGGAPSFLSPRVVFAFMLGFGSVGAMVTAYGASVLWASAFGITAGIVMAVLAYFVGYVMYKQQANSSLRPGQVVGKTGTVVTAIRGQGIGEINVPVGGQIVQFTASSVDGNSIDAGSTIIVVQDLGGRVTVRKSVSA